MKLCLEPGCREVVIGRRSRCLKHRRTALNLQAWRKRSRLQRTDYPLCADHLARGEHVAAAEVHHIVKRAAGGQLLGDDLLSLCRSCHSTRTRKGE